MPSQVLSFGPFASPPQNEGFRRSVGWTYRTFIIEDKEGALGDRQTDGPTI